MYADQKTIKLRRFLRHIILAAGRINKSKKAMSRIHDQMHMVKSVSSLGANDQTVHGEVDKLRGHIHDFLKHDKKLHAYHHESAESETRLREKIENVERKLDLFIELTQGREKKIATIEEKFKKKMNSQQEKLRGVIDNIKKLEKEYKKLAKSGKYDKKTLETMKSRIDSYKKQVNIN